MSNSTFKIGSVQLGADLETKTVVPITATDLTNVQTQSDAILHSTANLAEWRLDYLDQTISSQAIFKTAQALKMNLKSVNKGLLVTVRTKAQGGEFEDDAEAYLKQYQFILKQELADAIDVEFTTAPDIRHQLLKASGLLAVPVVLSYHDFEKTPDLTALKRLAMEMAELNVAAVKLALMPTKPQDILTLFQLADWAKTELTKPLAIMGMGNLGRITRASGNLFPSIFTFATLDNASAPGQMPLSTIETQLQLFKK